MVKSLLDASKYSTAKRLLLLLPEALRVVTASRELPEREKRFPKLTLLEVELTISYRRLLDPSRCTATPVVSLTAAQSMWLYRGRNEGIRLSRFNADPTCLPESL